MESAPNLVSVNAAAQELGLPQKTVAYWVTKGWVKAHTPADPSDRRTLVDLAQVQKVHRQRAKLDPRHKKRAAATPPPISLSTSPLRTAQHPAPHVSPAPRRAELSGEAASRFPAQNVLGTSARPSASSSISTLETRPPSSMSSPTSSPSSMALLKDYLLEFAGADPDKLIADAGSPHALTSRKLPSGKSGASLVSKLPILMGFCAQVPVLPATRGQVSAYINGIDQSPSSKDTYFRRVIAFLNWAEITLNIPAPNVKHLAPHLEKRAPVALTPEQAAAFLGQAKDIQESVMFELMLSCGLRSGEVCNLDRRDIKDDHLVIRGKTDEGTVPLDPTLRDNLLLLGREYVFYNRRGQRLARSGVYQRVHDALLRAQVDLRKMGGHVMRHTFGTLSLSLTGDIELVRQLMRHTNISTTQIYAQHNAASVNRRYQQLKLMDHISDAHGNNAAQQAAS